MAAIMAFGIVPALRVPTRQTGLGEQWAALDDRRTPRATLPAREPRIRRDEEADPDGGRGRSRHHRPRVRDRVGRAARQSRALLGRLDARGPDAGGAARAI